MRGKPHQQQACPGYGAAFEARYEPDLASAYFLDEAGRGITGNVGENDHFTPIRAYKRGPGNLVFGVIAAFDQDIGAQGLNELFRGLFVKDDDGLYKFQGSEE